MQQTKTRYSDTELAEFDEIITVKLDEAQKQLDYCLAELKATADNDDAKLKGLDDGVSGREVERLSALSARVKKHIQHLQNAKIRIQNKVYGVCRETGELISKERLKVVPHATLSIAAKQGKR